LLGEVIEIIAEHNLQNKDYEIDWTSVHRILAQRHGNFISRRALANLYYSDWGRRLRAALIEHIRADLTSHLMGIYRKSIQRIDEALDSDDHKICLRAAQIAQSYVRDAGIMQQSSAGARTTINIIADSFKGTTGIPSHIMGSVDATEVRVIEGGSLDESGKVEESEMPQTDQQE